MLLEIPVVRSCLDEEATLKRQVPFELPVHVVEGGARVLRRPEALGDETTKTPHWSPSPDEGDSRLQPVERRNLGRELCQPGRQQLADRRAGDLSGVGEPGEVGVDHHLDELPERRLRLPTRAARAP